MKFDKLVRDKIPEIIKKKGKQVSTHQADQQEYLIKLTDKLQEEVDEFMADQNLEELADILEVIQALCELMGYKYADLEKLRLNKKNDRGGFRQQIILDEVKD